MSCTDARIIAKTILSYEFVVFGNSTCVEKFSTEVEEPQKYQNSHDSATVKSYESEKIHNN